GNVSDDSHSVEDGPAAVPRHRLVLRLLTTVPQPGVEDARRHTELGGDQLARVHRAGADLALLATGLEQLAAVDARSELVVVYEHAAHPQDVRNGAVREDREPGPV